MRVSNAHTSAARPAWARISGALLALSIISAVLAGCTVLTSELPSALEQDGRPPEGIHYYLPKALVDLTLSVEPATAVFKVFPKPGLDMIADQDYRYYLRYAPLPQYHDIITVELWPKQGFLKKISANTTDETVEIIHNLAKLAGAFNPEGFEAASSLSSAVQLTHIKIDPADPEDLARAVKLMNNEVRAYAELQANANCKKSTEDTKAGFILDVQKRALCEAYRAVAAQRRHITLAFEPLHGIESRCKVPSSSRQEHHPATISRVKAAAAPKTAACSVGVCYRPFRPYELCATAGDAISRTIYEVPNGSELVEIDIRRALLVNKTQVIDFANDGSLSSMTVNKHSELLALSSLPLVVINGLAEGLTLRLKIVQKEVDLGKQSNSLNTARADLEKRRRLMEAAAAAAGGRTGAASFSTVPQTQQFSGQAATQSGGSPFDQVKPLN